MKKSKLPKGVSEIDIQGDLDTCDGCGNREWCQTVFTGYNKDAFITLCVKCQKTLVSYLVSKWPHIQEG